MSLFSTVSIKCPLCSFKQDWMVYDSVNVTTDPGLKDKVVCRQINSIYCNHCGAEPGFIKDFLYHDVEKQIFIYCYPEFLIGKKDEIELKNKQVMEKVFKIYRPSVKVVFGYDELFNELKKISTSSDDVKKFSDLNNLTVVTDAVLSFSKTLANTLWESRQLLTDRITKRTVKIGLTDKPLIPEAKMIFLESVGGLYHFMLGYIKWSSGIDIEKAGLNRMIQKLAYSDQMVSDARKHLMGTLTKLKKITDPDKIIILTAKRVSMAIDSFTSDEREKYISAILLRNAVELMKIVDSPLEREASPIQETTVKVIKKEKNNKQ